jgi:transcriptional regulator with XRE-family HTH domain
MLVQKLRLQRGWSQQQLAELSGLNVRTIQRIEKGQEPSVESLKSLAAVFNVDFLTLKEQGMENVVNESQSAEEILAFNQVRKLKGFYIHLAQYVFVIAILAVINALTTPRYWWVQWVILGWGVGLLSHWLQISERFSLFGSKWEKEQVEKRLGRKL